MRIRLKGQTIFNCPTNWWRGNHVYEYTHTCICHIYTYDSHAYTSTAACKKQKVSVLLLLFAINFRFRFSETSGNSSFALPCQGNTVKTEISHDLQILQFGPDTTNTMFRLSKLSIFLSVLKTSDILACWKKLTNLIKNFNTQK